jgi:phage FluMu gp28-like protein
MPPKRNTKREGAAEAGVSPTATAGGPALSSAPHPGQKKSSRESRKGAGGSHASSEASTPAGAAPANHGAGTLSIQVPSSPLDLLLSYQRNWKDDDSRFKIGLQARQTGKDFTMAAEGITSIYEKEVQGLKDAGWLLGAPSERQSLESLEKWKEWTQAYKLAIADMIDEREDPRNSESLLKSSTIVFPNGSRVIAVPGKPGTVRGFSMNVALTEFAFFEQPDETLRAVLPSITNPLRGGVKCIRLVSTPNGSGTKFHELVQKAIQRGTPEWNAAVKAGQKGLWSLHKVTIHDAVAAGLPVDIEELRAALDDPEGWAQEYECEFMDTAGVLLPYELIAQCESPSATMNAPADYWAGARRAFPVDLGIDFGRKKDLTVCVAAERIADMQIVRDVLELRAMSTPDQVEQLRPRIRAARRVALDYTGPGVGLGDYLVKEFGEWKPQADKFGKVELCTFTNALKVDIFPKLKMAFENRRLAVPVSRTLREDLHSVYRVVTPSGNVTYSAPHTNDGHADRCTALALCVRAGGGPAGIFAYASLRRAIDGKSNPLTGRRKGVLA